ncbi:MAG TPA: pectate lyase [Pirellulales bacterium]|nr:pectate lyase [Pirellulales bacterium]
MNSMWTEWPLVSRVMPVAAAHVLLVLAWPAPISAADRARDFLDRPDAWFQSAEGRLAIGNVLSFQTAVGDWPKNTDCVSAPYGGERSQLRGTFDNAATTDEMRLLARAIDATHDRSAQTGFERGLDHILAAQYQCGGWPQRSPPGSGYDRYITFNDDTMVRLMNLLRDVARDERYQFVDADRRRRAGAAFDRGIECILRCQVRIGGRLTVWCAQHDEVDLRPRPARTFELASLSGSESVRIVRLLMSLARPSPEVTQAIDAAVLWLDQAKLTGIRQEYEDDSNAPGGRNKIVVADASAPPLWARFYDLTTEKPIFVDRDGVPRARLSDIGYERRNGYAWLGTWAQELLATDYPAWCRQHGHQSVLMAAGNR